MLPLIRRNLKLFFRNRAGVFFSLLGALISFGLFIIFLKSNIRFVETIAASSQST